MQWDILDAFVQAAQEADIAHTDDFNRGDNEGVGYFDVNQRRGIRGNATKTPFIQCLHGERVQSEPASRGRVRMRSARAADAPSIAPHYLSTEEDRRIAADSLRLTRRIVAMPALARFKPREVRPGVQFQSDAELARLAGAIGTTIFHPVGTAKMGPANDPHAVVDAQLRVHGVQGLRVLGASVMPTITSGNTNAPVLMIAERAAEWIVRSAS